MNKSLINNNSFILDLKIRKDDGFTDSRIVKVYPLRFEFMFNVIREHLFSFRRKSFISEIFMTFEYGKCSLLMSFQRSNHKIEYTSNGVVYRKYLTFLSDLKKSIIPAFGRSLIANNKLNADDICKINSVCNQLI